MIRDLLLTAPRPLCVKEIYEIVRDSCLVKGYKPPSYQSTLRMMWLLRKIGLVKVVREEPARQRKIRKFWKKYYAVTPGMEDHPAWINPNKYVFYPEEFERSYKFYTTFAKSPSEWMRMISKMRRTYRGGRPRKT